jgi:hypothetical protein
MGLDEGDARQIIMQLARPHKFNYDGLTDSFDSFCTHRNDALNQMFNENHKNSASVKRSPLLSASSIATNQTTISINREGSQERQTRRNTVGEEGFFV